MDWVIIGAVTAFVSGQQVFSADMHSRHKFETEHGCNDYLKSEEFEDEAPLIRDLVEIHVNQPGTNVKIVFRCVPDAPVLPDDPA